MAKIILKSPYLKPIARRHIDTYIKYIATRDGVMPAENTDKYLPSTAKQIDLINSLVKDYPDTKESFEYEDYIANPNRENATAFIDHAIESHIVDRSRYIKYISERPGVEKVSSHGLFSDEGIPISVSKVSEEVTNSNSNVWTHIISLKREDAERLGYNTADAWMNLLRTHAHEFAEQMHIAPENFRWYAAFHNEGHHPHVHMVAYSIEPREAYLSVTGINNIKTSLAKDIFRDEMLKTYVKKDEQRDLIKSETREIITALVQSINQGTYDNEFVESQILNLAKKLANTSGKKVYGYLKPNVKAIIDSIVDELEKDDRIAQLYDLWYREKYEQLSYYTDELPARIPLSQNKEFKPIKNMIIQEALDINADILITNEGEQFVDVESEPTDNDTEDDEAKYSADYFLLLSAATKGNKWKQYALAKYLLDENNEEYDPEKAVEWLEKSVEQGYEVAQYKLGKMYLVGEEIPKDVEKGLEYLIPCAENGNAFAQYALGKLYLNGEDVERDLPKAIEYLLTSADNGNKYAMYTLGKLFCEGELVEKDIYNGMMYLKESARKGFVPAHYYLGKLYYLGNDVPKDIDEAEHYLRTAAVNGNPYAAYLLGRIYSNEEDYKDLSEAVKFFLQSAIAGNSFGYYQLGKIYYYGGENFDNDIPVAMEYLNTASEQGNQYAAQMLYNIYKHSNAVLATGALRLLQSLTRMLQRRLQDDAAKKQQQGIDKKEQQKINEKKQAHGLRISM